MFRLVKCFKAIFVLEGNVVSKSECFCVDALKFTIPAGGIPTYATVRSDPVTVTLALTCRRVSCGNLEQGGENCIMGCMKLYYGLHETNMYDVLSLITHWESSLSDSSFCVLYST